MRYGYRCFVCLLGMGAFAGVVRAAGIGQGDVMVYQDRDDPLNGLGSNATPISILDINPNTPGLVQTFAVTQSETPPLYTTKNNPIENLSVSNGGKLVSFAGWTSNTASGDLGTTAGLGRGAGTLDSNGNYGQPASYTPVVASTPDQPHAAYSPDGVNWYFGDTSGMYYNGGTTALTGSDGTLSIKAFGGNIYALHTLGSGFLPPDGTDVGDASTATKLSIVTPNPGPSVTGITYTPVLTLPTAAHDFAMGSTFNQSADTIYATTATGISKFSLVSGNWTAEGSLSLPGADGIAAELVQGLDFKLFVTVDPGVGGGNSTLDEITDTFVNGNLTLNASAPSVLYTAPSFDVLEGVAIAPVPEPGAGCLMLGAGTMVLRRRRRIR